MEQFNLDKLVKELCKLPKETTWVEFKHNNEKPEMIAENISALANSAVIADKRHAYLVWGIADDTHEIVGTRVSLKTKKTGNEEIENWLRGVLSINADFELQSVEIDGKHVELIIIDKAQRVPVTYKKNPYIRVGSYTKKLQDYPVLEMHLWDKLRQKKFEDEYAMVDLTLQRVFQLLDCDTYFKLLHIPLPTDIDGYTHYLCQENIIVKQDNGLYAITNLGALLFAKHLGDFNRLGRKAIRVVQYSEKSRMTILKEATVDEGYAKGLETVVKYVFTLLPTKEDIQKVQLTTVSKFPLPAIRETIANSVIHQDLYAIGTGPVVEIFENRVEITNPGTPMVDILRIVDNPPKSRNEKLADMMRRMKMCEELGRGWDRMVLSCEEQQLPAPDIHVYEEATRVSLYSYIEFANIPLSDKVWSTYLHACLKYLEGDALSNRSLRERFGLKSSSSGYLSRIIKEAVNRNLIKQVDPDTAPRYMRYIPFWA